MRKNTLIFAGGFAALLSIGATSVSNAAQAPCSTRGAAQSALPKLALKPVPQTFAAPVRTVQTEGTSKFTAEAHGNLNSNEASPPMPLTGCINGDESHAGQAGMYKEKEKE